MLGIISKKFKLRIKRYCFCLAWRSLMTNTVV